MIFRQLFDRSSSTYTYLLADESSREALFIDPVIDNINDYLLLLEQLELRLVIAIDTHTHADHVTALGKLRDATGCITMFGKQAQSTCATAAFGDGDLLQVGDIAVQCLYTPGHTDDSYTFAVEDGNRTLLFTGDTLLIRGSGRTDFQNGNAIDQFASLHQKLLSYPDDVVVFPGHDYRGWTQSTIGEERKYNPRLQFDKAEAYAAFMAKLDLPNPKLMDIAVPANRACGNS